MIAKIISGASAVGKPRGKTKNSRPDPDHENDVHDRVEEHDRPQIVEKEKRQAPRERQEALRPKPEFSNFARPVVFLEMGRKNAHPEQPVDGSAVNQKNEEPKSEGRDRRHRPADSEGAENRRGQKRAGLENE